MTHKDLKVGEKVMYRDSDEKVQAVVLAIDTEKRIVRFMDWEDFEWDEPFDDIPETVIRKL